jgi:hypothetical protein
VKDLQHTMFESEGGMFRKRPSAIAWGRWVNLAGRRLRDSRLTKEEEDQQVYSNQAFCAIGVLSCCRLRLTASEPSLEAPPLHKKRLKS